MRVPAYNEQMRYAVRDKGGRINGLQYGGEVAYERSANMGKALSGLAGTLEKASDVVFDTNMKLNEADATKALTQYQKEFLAKKTEIQQLKGEQALHALDDFKQWQGQRKQELTKDLSPVAMGMFEQKAGITFESNLEWVSNYQSGEEERYMDGVFQAHIDTLKDTYLQNINDPKLMRESQDQVFAAIQEFCNRKGLGQEVAKNMYKNTMEGIAKSGVGILIDNSDLGKARALLQHNSVYLSPDVQANLKKRISNEQERLNAKFEQQKISNTSKAVYEQYKTDPGAAIKALMDDPNLSFEQKQRVAASVSSMNTQDEQLKKIQRQAEFTSFKNETNALMQDPQKTDEEKMQYIQSLPMNSDERAYANATYSWTKRGYIPTATQDEFVRKYQATPDYAKLSRAELGNIFKDLAVECDAMQIHDPVEREKYMDNKMKQVEVDTWGFNDTISGYEYAKKVSVDPDYAKKKIVIPEEEMEIIKKNIEISDNETEYEIEEKIQNLYKIRHGLA